MSEPDEAGAQVECQYFTAADSAIKIGDECIFRVRPWRASGEYLGQLTGTVQAIFPGHELVYAVRVHAGSLPWPTWFVSMHDIAVVRW